MKIESDIYKMRESVRCAALGCRGKILAAVSGGADSVALLRLLSDSGVAVEAAHCNFQLRGAESERDMNFVTDLCRSLGIKLHVIRFDTSRIARERKISVEMTCRELRYDWFRKLAETYGFSRVAVAHNYDDNIETMLLNMIRGCGVEGMSGMSADNGFVIRPLLDFSRKDIEAYLSAVGASFITDSSNLNTGFNRNFIRLELLPLIERRWPAARKSLGLTRENMERDASVCYGALEQAIGSDTSFLSRHAIGRFPDTRSLIHRFLINTGHNPYIEQDICRALTDDERRPRVWHLGGKEIHLSAEGLLITEPAKLRAPESVWTPTSVNDPRECTSEECLLPHPEHYYEWRAALPGEKIRLLGARGFSLVSKVLKEGGVASRLRSTYPVLALKSGGAIVWIPGIKRAGIELIKNGVSEAYRLTLKEMPKKS